MFFIIRRFKHFYDSLNIVLVLDPGSSIFFNVKPYQEINFKRHLGSALFCRFEHVPCDCAYFCNEIENYKNH